MAWLRMLVVALRLVGPCWLAPWRSPLLRWRMETYGVTDASGRLLHAGEIRARTFLTFVIQRRVALMRFLRWAALL
jgi:hypothetical protein